MAYSRWVQSEFYTYWESVESNIKEDQLFAIFFSVDTKITFTYEETVEILEGKRSLIDDLNENGIEINDDQEKELIEYIQEFVFDVDRTFD